MKTAEREAAPANEPDTSSWVDAAAALVPVEVLGLHALAISLWTTSKEVTVPPRLGETEATTHVVTTMTNETNLQIAFWALIALAVVIFVGGKLSNGSLNNGDFIRVFIPPLAFVAWTMLQPGTAFYAVFHHLDQGIRIFGAAFAVVILGYVAKWMGDKATESTPGV
jgi:hypothetical protein